MYPEITCGLPRVRSQWPEAVSSLTVARQRGIFTRFPVFALAKTRVPQKFKELKQLWLLNLLAAVSPCQPQNTGTRSSAARYRLQRPIT
jgi:hypothetical protein